jgi:hypothetical protein
MIAAAAAVLLAVSPAADAPPPACDDYGMFCDDAVSSAVLRRFDVPPATTLSKQGYVGIRVFTVDGYGRYMPVVTILSRGGTAPTVETHEPGKSPRQFPASDATWQAATRLSAVMRAGPGSYVLADPNDFCMHSWSMAIEVIDAGGVTVRSRDTCALEQSGLDAQQLSNFAADDIPGCERLSRDNYQGIPAWRLRACFTLAASRRGVAAEAVNAFEQSPLGGDEEAGDWLTPDTTLDWPDRGATRGREAVARFWRIVTELDKEQSASDLGLGRMSAYYLSARAISDRRVRINGQLQQDLSSGETVAEFVQEWALGDDGRWRLADWQVGDFARERR